MWCALRSQHMSWLVLVAYFPLSLSLSVRGWSSWGELDRWRGENDRQDKGHSTWRWARAVSHGGIWGWRGSGGGRRGEWESSPSAAMCINVCMCVSVMGRRHRGLPSSKNVPLVTSSVRRTMNLKVNEVIVMFCFLVKTAKLLLFSCLFVYLQKNNKKNDVDGY